MPPSWTAGRRELEQKKLASSAGWTFAATVKDEEEEEEVDELEEQRQSKRHRTASKPTSELASASSASPATAAAAAAIPASVVQAAFSGPGCPSVAATANESLPPATATRKGKRSRKTPAHLRKEPAGSSGARTEKSTARSKKGKVAAAAAAAATAGRTAAKKKKTLTKGKGKGKVVQKKVDGKGKAQGKKRKKQKAAAVVAETPTVGFDSSIPGDKEMLAASALLGIGILDIAPAGAGTTEQAAAGAQASIDGGGGGSGGGGGGDAGSPIIDEAKEQLRIAQRGMDVMAAAADRVERMAEGTRAAGIHAVLLAFAAEGTEAGTDSVEGAAAVGPGVGGGSGAGGAGAGEAVGGYGGEAFGDFDDDDDL